MTVIFHLVSVLLIKSLLIIDFVSTDDVFGCGGFIKSHAEIDFSKVEVKLLTKQGSLKDATDCSPSNGYYFIPVYDKGEYIIRVSPPPGWSFEPEQFEINFDGKNDLCTLGKDINFYFKGFGITGKVGIHGQDIGAKGVRVDLKSANGNDIRHTHTDRYGVFEFTPVVPGKYILKASHDRWSFSKSEYIVSVETGNTEIPENSLLVSGFNVQGKIVSNGQPFKDVDVAIFSTVEQKSLSNCKHHESISLFKQNEHLNYEQSPICAATTENSGDFIFNSISPGKYIIKPFFQTKTINYHIHPNAIELVVLNDGVVIKQNFEVTGFDVSGRVLTSENGYGILAAIKLNGNIVTTTASNGSYVLHNIKPGTFTIQAEAENMEFADHTIKISSTNPSLPDIIVSAFKVCGQVVSAESHTVAITKEASTFHKEIQTSSSNSGEWCTFLPNGKYSVEVLLSNDDRQNGIQFFPLTQDIEVTSNPTAAIIFSQLRATVSGLVKCLPDSDSKCEGITIGLQSLDNRGAVNQNAAITENDGQYRFDGVLPGHYIVSLSNENRCWENQQFKITIKSATETVPTFIQTGYSVSILSSHSTGITYKQRNSANPETKTIYVESGLNTFCVQNPGVFDIEFSGCHIYDKLATPRSFSTKISSPVLISTSKHKNGIRILSDIVNNYKMIIEYQDRKETVALVEEKNKVDGYYAYNYEFYLNFDEQVKIFPQSDFMLFKPGKKEVTGGNECVDILFSFIATKGLVINGRIEPRISGAKVSLNFPKNLDLKSLSTISDENGEFRFGPIDSNIDVEIAAEKESYVFTNYDKSLNLFKAHKLCEIIVTIKDEKDDKLSGVLLSLSGGESYRKNLITGEDGTIKFHSLSPSQYYLRPMMKEYKFEPTSKMIDVKDGATAIIELSGKRVAFSAFGQVTFLNGEPFGNVLIEAISTSINNPKCVEQQEESYTEPNGNFRIRGLQPDCSYDIQIKTCDINSIVDRSIPSKTSIMIKNEDVKGINIIAISPLAFIDVIARIFASQNDYYKTLRIQLYKKGNNDSPTYSQRVEAPLNVKSKINPGIMVFFPRIPFDGKTYIIEISTSLSDKNFKYSLPLIQFTANSSSIYHEIEFHPKVRTLEHDLNHNSISALLLIAIVSFIFLKQELVLEVLSMVWVKLNEFVQDLISANTKESQRYENIVDDNEIEQLAQSINSVKKKKSKKII